MPSNYLAFDNGFPTFTGKESPQQQIAALHSYLFQVREGLQYSLSNLGKNNFNPAELEQMSQEQKTQMEQLLTQVYDQLNEIVTSLNSLTGIVNGHGSALGKLTEQMNDVNKALETLGDTLQVADDGSASLGAEGKRLNLIGEIYINGVLYEQGGTA